MGEWRFRHFCDNEQMDGTVKLTHSTVESSLKAVMRSLVRTHIAAGGAPDVDLRGEVFTVAMDAGWLSPLKAPTRTSVRLGKYMATKKVQKEFFDLLAEPTCSAENPDPSTAWVTPTPAELIGILKQKTGWSDVTICENARTHMTERMRLSAGDEAISPKTLRRMMKPGYNARPVILKPLALLMKKERPKELGTTHWQQLRWVAKES